MGPLPETTYYNPGKPDEDKQAEDHERAAVIEDIKKLVDTVQWFDEQIKACDRISTLDIESKVSIEAQTLARQNLIELLTVKKGEYESFLKAYKT